MVARDVTGVQVCALPVVPCITIKVDVLSVEGSIGSLKVAVMVSLSGTLVSALAGPVAPRTGAVVSGATPVVKLQLMSDVSALPARSLARSEERRVGKEGGAWWSAGGEVKVAEA